jgi:hypothetical protein
LFARPPDGSCADAVSEAEELTLNAAVSRTSAADSSRSLRAPAIFRIGSRTFWFFLMVLGERPSSPVASQSSAACRTV